MALIEKKTNSNEFLQLEDISSIVLKVQVVTVEKKNHFDRFKNENIERYFLTLSNGKIFLIQNEVNESRLLWNFASIEASLNQEITLYKTRVEVKGKFRDTIRVQYDILNKIKTKLGEN